jgi:hypothetical protein
MYWKPIELGGRDDGMRGDEVPAPADPDASGYDANQSIAASLSANAENADPGELQAAQAAGKFIYVDSQGVSRFATNNNPLNLAAGSEVPALTPAIAAQLQISVNNQGDWANWLNNWFNGHALPDVWAGMKTAGIIALCIVGGIILINVLELIPKGKE